MEQSATKAHPQFAQPVRQAALMVIISALVGFGSYIVFPAVAPVFIANIWLNGFIFVVFVVGIIACFWQVFELVSSVSWIEGFAAQHPGHDLTKPPRLLAPLAALLRARGTNMQISTASSRSILDSVATRMDEARDITRYIVNLLIFLGLLGTFYGLATTVPAVVATIQALNVQEGDSGTAVLSRLMTGLESQLGGMGTAFGSSLLGLAGSLVVGLLELFAGHGQNRFYRELEEWLSTITRVGFSSSDIEAASGSGDTSALGAILGQVVQQLDMMQDMVAQTAGERDEAEAQLGRLADAIEGLATKGAETSESDNQTAEALGRMFEGNERLVKLLTTHVEEGAGGGVDVESRMRLRSIDVQLLRILEEMSAGRQESMSDLRADLNALTKAIRTATRTAAPSGKG
jgi:hypothetical protein